jgi:hypothetical protein
MLKWGWTPTSAPPSASEQVAYDRLPFLFVPGLYNSYDGRPL